MKFTLIICTYMRDEPLLKLLFSIKEQTLYPNEILIIDGSLNDKTKQALEINKFENLKYHKVDEKNRGLTKQRNYGINLVSDESEIICFLDDDIILTPDYFENLIKTYSLCTDALAVGGYIINEVVWEKASETINPNKFYYDGWMRNEPSRFKLRYKFGLQPDAAPGFLPTFSHGRSIGFLPPSREIYQVEQIMGGVSSYKKEVFSNLSFSTYFEGYGLYEDADFSLRLAKIGKLYVNTSAQLYHYHDDSGRPNKFKYGKMVIRNGWYIWRVKYPNPVFKARIKWHATAFLLTVVRLSNIVNTNQKKSALSESLGRIIGWFSLIFSKPNIKA
ncbi:glycosyltransferase family 2 protein [Flavivirga abyssicola]|uniref:glycosyltransferase family 2 protein n=1 Tax=Flavivirga abyssicola TaxID=3063533 RepID=UPI0026DFA9DC|nr:glycosyltransferase family 2 protein [Flavivirga sp. MEBiC07777]WVK13627.1 glycosyltransferase family 2 protein [Flavivirga sp. MEBiC07777]